VKAGMGDVDLPMLVLHGGDDPLNGVEGAKALFGAAPHADKRLTIYPDTLHEPHNDFACDQVAEDVIEWVAHLTSASQ
jgi:alpha-beta hydrolase superfamily lysophospholipase